jgi:hypothetical protein
MIHALLVGGAMLAAATELLATALGISADEATELIEEEALKILENLDAKEASACSTRS